MPYTRYESEDAFIGSGAILRETPDFNYALTASEASNQKYVALQGMDPLWNGPLTREALV